MAEWGYIQWVSVLLGGSHQRWGHCPRVALASLQVPVESAALKHQGKTAWFGCKNNLANLCSSIFIFCVF